MKFKVGINTISKRNLALCLPLYNTYLVPYIDRGIIRNMNYIDFRACLIEKDESFYLHFSLEEEKNLASCELAVAVSYQLGRKYVRAYAYSLIGAFFPPWWLRNHLSCKHHHHHHSFPYVPLCN